MISTYIRQGRPLMRALINLPYRFAAKIKDNRQEPMLRLRDDYRFGGIWYPGWSNDCSDLPDF